MRKGSLFCESTHTLVWRCADTSEFVAVFSAVADASLCRASQSVVFSVSKMQKSFHCFPISDSISPQYFQQLQFLNAAHAEAGENTQAAEAHDGSSKALFQEQYPISAEGTPYASWSPRTSSTHKISLFSSDRQQFEWRQSVPSEKPPKIGISPTSQAGHALSPRPRDSGALLCGIGAALNKNSVGVVFVQQVGSRQACPRDSIFWLKQCSILID